MSCDLTHHEAVGVGQEPGHQLSHRVALVPGWAIPVRCYQSPIGTIIVDVAGTSVEDSPPSPPPARGGAVRYARLSGRRLIVVNDGEMKDDLVQDMIDVMTSFCARLYGRRSAGWRALAGVSAMESHDA